MHRQPDLFCRGCAMVYARQRDLFEPAGDNRPVPDYLRLATYAFRRTAGRAFGTLMDRTLGPDWRQEIQLAAWEAERSQMGSLDTLRFCSRAAYRALRNMGFARVRGRSSFLLRAVRAGRAGLALALPG